MKGLGNFNNDEAPEVFTTTLALFADFRVIYMGKDATRRINKLTFLRYRDEQDLGLVKVSEGPLLNE